MKKKILTLISISLSLTILFGACSNTATVSTDEIESSNEITSTLEETETETQTSTTSSTTTTEEPTTSETTTVPPTTTQPETTTKNEANIEPITTYNSTTATTMAPIRFNGPVEANRFIDHGKVLTGS